MTNSSITGANPFDFVGSQFLSEYGVDLREEYKTRESYYLHMENFPLKLKKVLTQSSTIYTSVPCPLSFLQDTESLYELFPEFHDYLIVFLLKESNNIIM